MLVGLPLTSFSSENVLKYSTREIKCMGEAIYFESRGQPQKGMIAVAHVTKNRLESDEFDADNVCGIVYQKGQYSWTKKRNRKIMEPEQFFLALEIAKKVLSGEIHDPTHGALYFKRAKKVRGMKAKIGDHVFY